MVISVVIWVTLVVILLIILIHISSNINTHMGSDIICNMLCGLGWVRTIGRIGMIGISLGRGGQDWIVGMIRRTDG